MKMKINTSVVAAAVVLTMVVALVPISSATEINFVGSDLATWWHIGGGGVQDVADLVGREYTCGSNTCIEMTLTGAFGNGYCAGVIGQDLEGEYNYDDGSIQRSESQRPCDAVIDDSGTPCLGTLLVSGVHIVLDMETAAGVC